MAKKISNVDILAEDELIKKGYITAKKDILQLLDLKQEEYKFRVERYLILDLIDDITKKIG